MEANRAAADPSVTCLEQSNGTSEPYAVSNTRRVTIAKAASTGASVVVVVVVRVRGDGPSFLERAVCVYEPL
jgi:hypothetical protein